MIDSSVVESTYDMIKAKMTYLKDNYEKLGFEEPWITSTIDPQSILSEHRSNQPIPVWRVSHKSKTFRAIKPIIVRMYREGDLFFAENENLVVCGTGPSPQEAFQDFCVHLAHFFEYYKKLQAKQLRGDALRLKKLFKNLFVME